MAGPGSAWPPWYGWRTNGAYVFVTGRRKDVLDAAVETIGPARAAAVVGDISRTADLERLY